MCPPDNQDRPCVIVKLKTRASRTRERTEELIEVEAPTSEVAQVKQLTELVQSRFPGSELRVFHEGAGSFTMDDLHVVAAYQEDAEAGFAKRPAAEPSSQDDDGFEQLPLIA